MSKPSQTKNKVVTIDVTIDGIEGRQSPVSGLLDKPCEPLALLVLAHGAGAGMDHAFMRSLALSLCSKGIATLRFQFPYMEDGSKRPDSPKLATAAVAAAIAWAQANEPGLPIIAGGKSFGARMTTTAAAIGLLAEVKGIVCFGFPLHPANKPAIDRAKHLKDVPVPTLFLQGTRDALAELSLMGDVVREISRAKMQIIQGADHSFAVLKSSGRTATDVLEELTSTTQAFCRSLGLG